MRPSSGFHRPGAAALLATSVLLLLPAAGEADLQTFGSDLAATAGEVRSEQRDVAYWQTAFADGRLPTVPVDGQIKEVRLKGFAHSDREPGALGGGGETGFHVQALTPGGASARITSQFFDVPNRKVGDASTITTYRPENFCVKQGEAIALNSIGGWDGVANRDPLVGPVGPYPDGTPLQIFASVPSATTTYFTADQGTNNGQAFQPRPGHPADRRGEHAGLELLMQMTLATGEDRSYECGGPNTYRPADAPPAPKPGGGGAPPGVQKTTIPRKQRVGVSKKGVAGMALFCQPGPRACAGTVTIYAATPKGDVAIGSKRYSIAQKSTGKAKIKLSAAGHRLFKSRGRKLPVRIEAVTQPGGAVHTDRFQVTLRKVGAR